MVAKLTIDNTPVETIISKAASDQIDNITSTTSKITFTNKAGESTEVPINGDLPDIIHSGNVGQSGNSTITINQGSGTSTMNFTIPYFTVDKNGRVTSSSNRTVSITRPAYTNYNNYNNYSDYGNYHNYSDYYNYGNYSSYSNYSSYGSND